jgi:hypothetical protein
LDRDRWGRLAVKAYSDGVIDFASSHRSDDRWKLREALVLSEVERKELVELERMLHDEDVHAAQYIAGNSVFQYYWEQAQQRFNTTKRLRTPYLKQAQQQDDPDRVAKLWSDAFGDPNDPDVRADVEKTIEILKNRGQADGCLR